MQALTITLFIFSAMMGLAIGSFLNVVIYRLPQGKFFSKARSYCPKCGADIKAYDNIPVLSYILLRGKCRNCGERISLRYPAIELLCCILWVVNFAVFGISFMTIIYDILVSTLIVIAMIDFDTMEIPDSSQITILLLGLVTFFPISGISWQSKLIGLVCISIPMLIVAFFGGMGLGDVKLYAVLGLLFGWQKILLIFLLSAVLGGLFSVIYLVVNKKKENLAQDDMDDEKDKQESNVQETLQTTQDEVIDDNIITDNQLQEDKQDNAISVNDDNHQSDDSTASENSVEDKEEEEPKGKMIAFGPFICIATLITLYFGEAIINGYVNLILP